MAVPTVKIVKILTKRKEQRSKMAHTQVLTAAETLKVHFGQISSLGRSSSHLLKKSFQDQLSELSNIH